MSIEATSVGAHKDRRAQRLVALVLLAWGLVEVVSWVALRVVAARNGLEYRRLEDFFAPSDREKIAAFLRAGEGNYYRPDPDLGWAPRPSTHVAANGAYQPMTTNARGLRSLREYADVPPDGVLRVEAFGDSFVHGDEVADTSAWTAVLERSRPGLEVLNFGASGYGADQALLRWERDGKPLRPHVVLIGFMTENIGRTVNVFRPFYTPQTAMRLTKPRFTLRDGRLELLPAPLRTVADYRPLLENPAPLLESLGREDAWYQRSGWHPGTPLDVLPSVRLLLLGRRWARRLQDPDAFETSYAPEGAAFRVTEAVLARFAESVRAASAVPIVVFFPNQNDLQRRRQNQVELVAGLVEALRRRGVETVDLLEPIHAETGSLPMTGVFGSVHYSAATNAIVARALGEAIDRHRQAKPVGRDPAVERRPPADDRSPVDRGAVEPAARAPGRRTRPATAAEPASLGSMPESRQCLQRSACRPLFSQSESVPGRSVPAPSDRSAVIGPLGCGTPVTDGGSFFAVTVTL
ncbi:MAG: hypothetical protein ACKPBU_12375 [Alphaproteobacteria bacterium]